MVENDSKSTISYALMLLRLVLFLQNKANLPEAENGAYSVITMVYGDFRWIETAKKQSQTNPIS